MDLGLHRNGRPLRNTIDIDAIVRSQEWIGAMGKSTCLLVWIEAETNYQSKSLKHSGEMLTLKSACIAVADLA